ncbi:hypothetical protein MNBD_GAMMA22-134 [hydrothermal vent metagenome]|uniref:Thioredoxin-like fold domain-containing protein n=1 Tax=hydrothermal vent metagenome TaxID=652676 RepID=A0A3B1A3R3_9ZZZZ
MKTKNSPDNLVNTISATMLLTSDCSHCPTVLAGLMPLIKSGQLSSLEVINLDQQPQLAEQYNTRTVPWVQFKFALGQFHIEGLHSEKELQQWCDNSKTLKGISHYCLMLLDQGKINELNKLINDYPNWLHSMLLLVEDIETSLTIRVGISAIFESLEATQFEPIYQALLLMTKNNLARIRSDACFYLSLTKNPNAILTLTNCLKDENAEVQEIAADAIADLEAIEKN